MEKTYSPTKIRSHQERPMVGMLSAIGAFFFFSVMNMFAKLLAPYHSVTEIGFYRNLIGFMPFLILMMIKGRQSIRLTNPKGVLLRAFLGTASLLITFAAFIAMPMADVTAFLFTTSLLIPVLSVIILKEHVGLPRWSAVVIGFIGVLIMVQPTGAVNVLGVCLALGAASMHAFMGILLRYLGRTESPFAATYYFMLVGLVLTGLMMPFIGSWPDPDHYWMIAGIGLSGAIAQFCLATAFKNAQAVVVTIFSYSSIIWATVIGFLVWEDWPNQAIFIGGFIVISCNLFILFREQRIKNNLP